MKEFEGFWGIIEIIIGILYFTEEKDDLLAFI